MDPDEIARRELDRLEKKKRKQERRLLKAQNKASGSGDLFHTPGSDSDSGVSHVTDTEHNSGLSFDSSSHHSSCDPLQNQRHPERDLGGADNSALNSGSVNKLNPFSVESLLSDSRPRRTPAALPPSRPLIGKGHFLLYPITQPLGFIVPQTALKTNPAATGHGEGQSGGSRADCAESSATAEEHPGGSSPSRSAFQTHNPGVSGGDALYEPNTSPAAPGDADRKELLEHLENKEDNPTSVPRDSPVDCTKDME